MSEDILEIVNNQDEIIGLEKRSIVHTKGLKHREIHVFFFTDDGVIFQHRAKDKDTYPDMLDATIGGHVDPGENYIQSALREVREESGIRLNNVELYRLDKINNDSFDKVTGNRNNVFRTIYAYYFNGDISNLLIEDNVALGFVLVSWNELFDTRNKRSDIIDVLLSSQYLELYFRMKSIIDIKKWSEDKKKIDCCGKHKNVKRGEVWWSKTGKNIGFEQNGGRDFRRPIVILKRINFMLALVAPITSQKKNMKSAFYINLPSLIEGVILVAQIRVMSTKRMLRRKFKLPDEEINSLLYHVKEFFFGGKTNPASQGGGPGTHKASL